MKKHLKLFLCLAFAVIALALTVGAADNKELLNDIFTFKGYSIDESGDRISVGYDINIDAIESYKNSYNADLSYGIVFSPFDMLQGKAPLDENGQPIRLEGGKALKADLTNYSYAFYDLIVSDIPKSAMDTRLVISAYIIDGGNIYYVQDKGLSDTVDGISLNEVLNGRIYEDELGFKYQESNGELTVIAYNGKIDSSIVKGIYIPYSYNGMKITAIGDEAFKEFGERFTKTEYVNISSDFVKINLPTSIKEIGDNAFEKCYCIKLIVYNENLSEADYKSWDKNVTWGKGTLQARDTIWKFRPAIGWSRYSLVEIPEDY